jgi:hypothetical protein
VIAECPRCGVVYDYKQNSDLIDGHKCDRPRPAYDTWRGGPSPADPVEMDLYRCKKEGHVSVEVCWRCGDVLGEPELPA